MNFSTVGTLPGPNCVLNFRPLKMMECIYVTAELDPQHRIQYSTSFLNSAITYLRLLC